MVSSIWFRLGEFSVNTPYIAAPVGDSFTTEVDMADVVVGLRLGRKCESPVRPRHHVRECSGRDTYPRLLPQQGWRFSWKFRVLAKGTSGPSASKILCQQ
jgi:hypothetical protein